jgi:hypothetical protein
VRGSPPQLSPSNLKPSLVLNTVLIGFKKFSDEKSLWWCEVRGILATETVVLGD